MTLEATVLSNDATDKTVTWSSSNTDVATVENGVMSAVAPGEVIITATVGDKEATCEVTIKAHILAGLEQLTTDKSQQTIYDLSGRRVTHPTKGIYIIGEHKVVIK